MFVLSRPQRFLYIFVCCGPWCAATLGHCVGTGGGGAAVGSRGHGLHSTERAWRGARRHCGSSPSTAAHKLNLLCTWWKLFPHFCRMRKLLLLIIFPLNAVGSTFSFGTTSIFLLRSHPWGLSYFASQSCLFVCSKRLNICQMRKILLLIIFPLNAVSSTFSFGTTSIFLLRSHP